MADTDERSSKYERTRKDFESLDLDDKAVFLIEATAATVARGVQQAGTALAKEVDTFFEQQRSTREQNNDDGPGPAEPETSPNQG